MTSTVYINEGRTLKTLHNLKTVTNTNVGNTLKPQKAIEGPSLVRKTIQSSKPVKQVKEPKSTYNKFVMTHINGGLEWLTKHGFGYNSSVQPILAIDKGVIHSIVLYPTVIVADGSLLICKNVKPEEAPTDENVIANIKINVTAEELPTPILILVDQLLLLPEDRISIYSTIDTTGVDIELYILYI